MRPVQKSVPRPVTMYHEANRDDHGSGSDHGHRHGVEKPWSLASQPYPDAAAYRNG